MSRLQTVPTPLMLSLALAFAPAAASADDTSLAPVTVSASALALGSDQMSTPASVLAGDELVRRRAATLGETFTVGNGANYGQVLICTGNGTALTGNVLTVELSYRPPGYVAPLSDAQRKQLMKEYNNNETYVRAAANGMEYGRHIRNGTRLVFLLKDGKLEQREVRIGAQAG